MPAAIKFEKTAVSESALDISWMVVAVPILLGKLPKDLDDVAFDTTLARSAIAE